MGRPFKNALCRTGIPDAYGYGFSPPFELCCKRRKAHPGRHRVVFSDGSVREWATGDEVSELTKKAHDDRP